jgi:hypothetical protein
LIADELVVRKILVKGIDDPVTVSPSVITTLVAFEAVGIGIMGDIEPVSSPTFAVMGGSEGAIHESFPSVVGCVRKKLFDFVGGWGESKQIEVKSTDKDFAIRFCNGNDTFVCELGV